MFEESSSEFDMVTDRWSIKIDQFETWTIDDYGWRESALVGSKNQRVDAYFAA